MSTTFLPLSALPIFKFKPKISNTTHNFSLNSLPSPRNVIHFDRKRNTFDYPKPQNWKLHAISEEIVVPDNPEQIVSSTTSAAGGGGDITETVIQVLLFSAFLVLTLLTIGVIYLAVTDFLAKRENAKIEKEEEAKLKKGGKRKIVKARKGPRGFGQKVAEFNDISDD